MVSSDEKSALLRLASGKEVSAHGSGPAQGEVTLALRPEHARLEAETAGLLSGALRDVVYFGTDTHLHVRLDDGTDFVLRRQNSPTETDHCVTGQRVGLSFPNGAAQVLRD